MVRLRLVRRLVFGLNIEHVPGSGLYEEMCGKEMWEAKSRGLGLDRRSSREV